MALPESGYTQPVEIVVGGTLSRNGYVQPVEIVAGSGMVIGLPVTGGTPGSVLFVDAGGNLGQNNASFFWDNTNSILKLGIENMLQLASTGTFQPFRIMTNHYSNLGVTDPVLTIGYNIAAGGAASASNPITAGIAQHQIGLEANWSPSAGVTQVEFNHDYWSPDATTHRRGFLMVVRNDNYNIQWTWNGDAYVWNNSTAATLWMQLNSTTLQVTGGTLTLNTVNIADDGSGNILMTPGVGNQVNIQKAVVGATLFADIHNTDNTNAASGATLNIFTGGASAGSPSVHYLVVGTQDWSHGINNASSQAFQICAASSLGTNTRFSMTPAGVLSLTGPVLMNQGASASAPDYAWQSATNTGMYLRLGAIVGFSFSGTEKIALLGGNGLFLSSDTALKWASSTNTTGSFDVVISRTGTKALQILNDATASLGFLNATPVAQQTSTGNTTYAASGAVAVTTAGTFTGGSGATAYTIGDIVLALKNYGLLKT